ncbi:MAG: PQQ-dependent sugar dehydrogenase [Deltaproteobacteria bacterium]|nr:PQQ-dependent sugar dehydrogenase [Deltaproteobacteria bacterium]
MYLLCDMTRAPFQLLVILAIALLSSREAAALPANFAESTVASGLSQPTSMTFAPDGRLFILEKVGRVRVMRSGSLLAAPFLTLAVETGSERGLLGLAFDPNFSSNRFLYVYYTRTATPIKNRVSRFRASATNADLVEAGSETVILDDIASDAGNHNGGAIHFGPDGKLYIAVGDGGSNSSNAQSLANLSGKILRINADGSVPTDNPFFNTAGARREIWAYGLRNPYTFSFDPLTGRMHVNDVGQSTWEEINLGAAGANYGWPTCEGPQNTGQGSCTNGSFSYPVYAYQHPQGFAITGGVFYRGSQFPGSYSGSYFFSDYIGGFITRLNTTNQPIDFALGGTASSPVDLDVASDGSLYYLSYSSGQVRRIRYLLSDTACDLDSSGLVTVVDVQLSINQALGVIPCTGDINSDGQCNVVDVQRIVNTVLGGACVTQ